MHSNSFQNSENDFDFQDALQMLLVHPLSAHVVYESISFST